MQDTIFFRVPMNSDLELMTGSGSERLYSERGYSNSLVIKGDGIGVHMLQTDIDSRNHRGPSSVIFRL